MESKEAIQKFEQLKNKASKQIEDFERIFRCKSNYRYDKELFETAIKAIKFKEYFDEMYGKGLEISNWHLNGELEPFDNFYEGACE